MRSGESGVSGEMSGCVGVAARENGGETENGGRRKWPSKGDRNESGVSA